MLSCVSLRSEMSCVNLISRLAPVIGCAHPVEHNENTTHIYCTPTSVAPRIAQNWCHNSLTTPRPVPRPREMTHAYRASRATHTAAHARRRARRARAPLVRFQIPNFHRLLVLISLPSHTRGYCLYIVHMPLFMAAHLLHPRHGPPQQSQTQSPAPPSAQQAPWSQASLPAPRRVGRWQEWRASP